MLLRAYLGVREEPLCGENHLFENHELIQEVNTLAGEQLPDGLLSFKAQRVRGGAPLGRLVLQELCYGVVLRKKYQKTACREISFKIKVTEWQESAWV